MPKSTPIRPLDIVETYAVIAHKCGVICQALSQALQTGKDFPPPTEVKDQLSIMVGRIDDVLDAMKPVSQNHPAADDGPLVDGEVEVNLD